LERKDFALIIAHEELDGGALTVADDIDVVPTMAVAHQLVD